MKNIFFVILLLTSACVVDKDSNKVTDDKTEYKIGTIVSMQAGDRACYVKLLDEKNNKFDALADFDICENKNLIGKKSKLFYEQGNVLAMSCQGNMDCDKSDVVDMIVRVELW
jgi:hypothetical protein